MRTLKPTPGNVFVEPIGEVQSDIIAIPKSVNEHEMPRLGRVVAIGGCLVTKKGVRVMPEFKVGDTVLFPRATGMWMTFEGQRLIQIKQHNVIGVFGTFE